MTEFIKTTFEHFRQKMRHHISTLYAAMNVPEPERSYFYFLMGHSADINTNVYQTPLSQKTTDVCFFVTMNSHVFFKNTYSYSIESDLETGGMVIENGAVR